MTILFILKKYNIMEENIQRGVKWGKLEVGKNFEFLSNFFIQKIYCKKFSFYPNNKSVI